MNFAQPLWLITGSGVCIALSLFIRMLHERRRAALAKFAAHQLLGRLTRNISSRKRRIKNIFVISAVFMCFVALARPQYGFKWIDVKRKGIDILFALDTSKSMLAEDIKPNRLERAHYAILDFVRQLEGDRVGLMPFAGSAFLMCPLTLDYNAFEHSLSAVTADIIPQGGTDIAAVINSATITLNNSANHKILVLITDGENLQGDALQAAVDGEEKGLTIYTVGVGTREGELIPLPEGGFVKDGQGQFITSKLDEQTLGQIAEKSGGLYVPLGSSGEGLETVYQEKLSLIPKEELAERRQKVPLERFEYPLALAIILLVCDFLLGERKSKRSLSQPLIKSVSRRVRRKSGLLILALFLTVGLRTQAHSSEGEEAYNRGDYIAASEYYSQQLLKSPDDPKLHYNFGAAAYKNNMFDDAIASFSKALASNNIDLQKKAYYNRGNSYYRKGLEMVQGDPQSTVQQWQKALESMEAVLELSPDDDAAYNRDLIKKQLEELQKQQEQKQQEQGKDKDKDNKEQKKGDKEQNSSQNQSSDENSPQPEKKKGKKEKNESQAQKKEQESNQANVNQASKKDEKKAEEDIKEEQAAMDAQRQQQGKMTKEEAERLLNGLKSEEGELNFVPLDRAENNSSVRDW